MTSLIHLIISGFLLSFFEPLGAYIYSIPIKKRRHFGLWGVSTFFIYLLLASAMSYLQIIWFIQVFVKFFALAMISFCITQSNYTDCFYIAIWAHTTHMVLFNILCILSSLSVYEHIFPNSFLLQTALVYLPGYLLAYFILVRHISLSEHYHVERKQVIIAFFTIIPFNIFNNVLFADGQLPDNALTTIYCCCFSSICSLFVLYLQRTSSLHAQFKQEYRLMQQVLNQRQLQYELSKENIEIINQKCHDLKHQIQALQKLPASQIKADYIKEVSDSLMIYDSVFRTGNEVLDTLLTEKSLYCFKNNITIKCIADGKCLDFMNPIDLYSLMGNAIDNSIESVRKLEDPSLRMINIYVKKELHFVSITIENYVSQIPVFVDGLPITDKEDKNYHGFGIKSMQYTAQKYDGQMTLNIENSMFIVRFLFPSMS